MSISLYFKARTGKMSCTSLCTLFELAGNMFISSFYNIFPAFVDKD